MPTHTKLVSWQLAQLPFTPVWIMLAVGTGNWKPVPGTDRLAFAATRLDGVLPAWQVSQLALVGMWAVGPGMADCGIVMMLEMP